MNPKPELSGVHVHGKLGKPTPEFYMAGPYPIFDNEESKLPPTLPAPKRPNFLDSSREKDFFEKQLAIVGIVMLMGIAGVIGFALGVVLF